MAGRPERHFYPVYHPPHPAEDGTRRPPASDDNIAIRRIAAHAVHTAEQRAVAAEDALLLAPARRLRAAPQEARR